MAVDFNLPTVATSYTAFPTQIIENIDAALQQLSVGSPSNVPTNAIKWDATANRWKKYNGSAYVDLTTNYDLNANLDVTQLTLGDSEKIRLGAGQDLQIFHDQTLGHSFIKDTGTGNLKICGSTVELVNAANTALLLKASQGSGGATSLYQDGDERLKTLSTGVEIFGTSLDLGDNVSLNLGTNNDLKLVHNDTDGTIENTKGILNIKKSDGSGGSQNGIVLEANSDISFYQSTGVNGDPQLKVNANGIFLRGQQLGTSLNNEVIIFDNLVKANNNDNKFHIKHVRDSNTDATWQGSATRLQMRVDSTDQGYIQFNGADNNYGMEIGTTGLEKFAFFVRGGKSELYFDNVPKLATASGGVDITGSLTTTSAITITNASPIINFVDDGDDPDYRIVANSGQFKIQDKTNSNANRVIIQQANTRVLNNLLADAGVDVTGSINTTGELNFTGSNAKFIDFETLAGPHRFELRHHNPTGNLFETAIKATANGSVDLFYDAGTTSTARLSTTANGISLPSANTATTPALSFGTDTNSGIFHRGADSIGFSAAGQIFYIDTTGLYTNTAKGIHLKAQNNTQFLTLKPSATMASNFSLTLPDADTTVAGYALISDGSGQLSWGVAGAGAQGGGSDEIFWENGQAVTTNYTITNGKNAGSFGPITINSGVTVTVGDGETWSVV